jgi:hypothetical protein
MFGLKFLAATALLAQGILAEGVHLLNCRSFGEASTPVRTYVSIVAVCEPVKTEPVSCLPGG